MYRSENLNSPMCLCHLCSTVEQMLQEKISSLSLFFICSYALPTKSTEIMLMQEQGTKMYVDAVLKTHERVVQVKLTCFKSAFNLHALLVQVYLSHIIIQGIIMVKFKHVIYLFVQLSSLNTTLCPVFMDVLLKNQPEGVQLSVKEVSWHDDSFQSRKRRGHI